jgi:post-segregation antitoxin (ccd killing protein)
MAYMVYMGYRLLQYSKKEMSDMKTTVYLDEDSVNAANDLPRKINVSKLLRWAIKAATTDNKTWMKLIKTEGEIKEVQDFLRPRLMMILGITEEQRKKFLAIIDNDKKGKE